MDKSILFGDIVGVAMFLSVILFYCFYYSSLVRGQYEKRQMERRQKSTKLRRQADRNGGG